MCVQQGGAVGLPFFPVQGREVGSAVEEVGMCKMWAGRQSLDQFSLLLRELGWRWQCRGALPAVGSRKLGTLRCIAVGWLLYLGPSQLRPARAVCVLAVPQLWLFPASLRLLVSLYLSLSFSRGLVGTVNPTPC